MATNARGLNSSPGIYTREIDLSYSAKSLGITTLGLVGETQIGPAFQAIPITNYTEFKYYFGGTNPEKFANGYPKYELPYIAKSYLSESNQLYVTRVLGLSGFRYNGMWALYNNGTNTGSTVSDKTILATIRPKSFYSGQTQYPCIDSLTASNSVTGTSQEFTLTATYSAEYKAKIGGTGTTTTYKISLDPNSKNYILSVLGSTVKGSANSLLFVEEMFEAAITNLKDFNKSTVNGFYTGVSDRKSVV